MPVEILRPAMTVGSFYMIVVDVGEQLVAFCAKETDTIGWFILAEIQHLYSASRIPGMARYAGARESAGVGNRLRGSEEFRRKRHIVST